MADRLNADELATVFDVVDPQEPVEKLEAAQRSGQKACMALFAMLRELASVAPSDASFMIGYDPTLLRQGTEGNKTPEQKELEWWQELMGFLFVGTFAGRWPNLNEAVLFQSELIGYLQCFPRVLGPREEFWRRVSARRKASSVGFRPSET